MQHALPSVEEPTVVGRAVAFATRHLRTTLVVYGILFACFGLVRLDRDIHGSEAGVSPYRLAQLAASMDMINHHGPPLTGVGNGGPSSFSPIAIDDDRGGFVYLSLAGYFLKTRNIGALLKWSFILFFIPLLLVYPLLLYEITSSVVAAIAAPPILLGHASFLQTSGFFWMPAWANLFFLPLLLLLNKHWRASWLWLFIPLAVVASFASSVRANAGLGFVIGSLILILARVRGWAVRLVMIGLVLLAYVSVSSFAMHAIQVQRDAVVGHDFTSAYPNGHPLWHNLYMGLGYVKNPYGIRIKDQIAVAAAKREDPGAVFPTNRYENALRRVYFKTLERHPGFVAREYLIKAGVVAGSAVVWFPFAVVLTPVFLLFGRRKDRRRRGFELMLLSGAGLIGAATGVLINPARVAENQSGWYSALLVLWLVVLGWLARPIEQRAFPVLQRAAEQIVDVAVAVGWRNVGRVFAVRAKAAPGLPVKLRSAARLVHISATHYRRNRLLRLVLVVLIPSAVFVADASTRSSYTSATFWTGQGTLITPQSSIPVIAHWNLAPQLPQGWVSSVERVKARAHQLLLVTNKETYGHQIESAPQRLGPGRYLLEVSGRVLKGALRVGVVDERLRTYITSAIYWSGQPFRADRRMGVSFELAETAPTKILFTNYKVNRETTLWSLRSIDLRELEGGCRLFDPSASFGPLHGY